MNKAKIFDIQKFCIHDGPGIRTTIFFKGCPLQCLWCHNPESQQAASEILYSQHKCTHCGECAKNCRQQAIQITAASVVTNAAACLCCETCVDYCPGNARELTGSEYTVAELLVEIEKDRIFYDQSNGGVTLSGGEALCQIDFVEELVKTCKARGISVAVDTCGFVPFESFAKIIDYVDLFLYDIKLINPELHQQFTGCDNRLILENLLKLSQSGAKLNLRLPLIEGINTSHANIMDISNFMKKLNNTIVNLLPYHDIGSAKYQRLGRQYPAQDMATPTTETLEKIKFRLEQETHCTVIIGG